MLRSDSVGEPPSRMRDRVACCWFFPVNVDCEVAVGPRSRALKGIRKGGRLFVVVLSLEAGFEELDEKGRLAVAAVASSRAEFVGEGPREEI